MAKYKFTDLKEQYDEFRYAIAQIFIAGEDFTTNPNDMGVSELDVELTSGFEASIATVTINNVYDRRRGEFMTEKIKKYILLGSAIKILMGYGTKVAEVFRGFIARVNFSYSKDRMPAIILTCMDVKGMMMANSYARQLKAKTWSAAVKEIFDQEYYKEIKSDGIIDDYTIQDTPDAQQGAGGGDATTASDKSIEIVNESDYEFIVKIAKRYNYDFFVIRGQVIFRAAKSDTESLYDMGVDDGVLYFSTEYDITGLAKKIEVRNFDPSAGKSYTGKMENNNNISMGSNAVKLITGSTKIYTDPSATSQSEVDSRAAYLYEDMVYRLGTMEAEMVGLPELVPGKFIELQDFGKPVENMFYLTTVRHHMAPGGDFRTYVTGKAAKIKK